MKYVLVMLLSLISVQGHANEELVHGFKLYQEYINLEQRCLVRYGDYITHDVLNADNLESCTRENILSKIAKDGYTEDDLKAFWITVDYTGKFDQEIAPEAPACQIAQLKQLESALDNHWLDKASKHVLELLKSTSDDVGIKILVEDQRNLVAPITHVASSFSPDPAKKAKEEIKTVSILTEEGRPGFGLRVSAILDKSGCQTVSAEQLRRSITTEFNVLKNMLLKNPKWRHH